MTAPLADLFRTARPVPLGRLTLTLPSSADLGGGELRSLAMVAAADVDGLDAHAAKALADLEARLGVNSDHRMIAGTAEEPDALTEEEIERAVEAHELLRRRESQRLWRTADSTLSSIEAARRRRADKAERVRVALATAEAVALAEARGEALAVDTVAGKTARARRVSGLELAFERGVLDGEAVSAPALKRAGEAYRDAYEIAVGGRGPDRSAQNGGGSKYGSKTPVVAIEAALTLNGSADQKAEAAKARRGMRYGMSKVQIAVCDAVCGLDMTVNATAQKLKKDPRTVEKNLRSALVIVGENRGWW